MENVRFVTFWWGRGKKCINSSTDYFKSEEKAMKTYDQLAEEWEKQMKRYKLKYYIEEKTEFDNLYQEGISNKPFFVNKCLDKFNEPIVYLDVDMRLHKKPYIFGNSYFDFMGINWNADNRAVKNVDFYTFETNSEVMYFNNTEGSKKLLKSWMSMFEDTRNKKKADDRLLAVCFKQKNFINDIKCYWLPMEYFYIPEFYKNSVDESDVVISHPNSITSEEMAHAFGASKNRIPTIYDKIIQSKSQTNMNEYFNYYFTNRNQISHYKQLNISLKKHKKKTIIPFDKVKTSKAKLLTKESMDPKMLLQKLNEKPYYMFSTIDEKEQTYYDIMFDNNMKIKYLKVNPLTMSILRLYPNYKNNISLVLGLRIA